MGGYLSSERRRLQRAYIDNTPALAPKDGQRVKIVGVYAGNLVTVAGLIGNKMYCFKIQLRGIHVPNVLSNNNEEKRKGQVVMDALSTYALNRIVVLTKIRAVAGPNTYEAYIFIDGQNLTNYLVSRTYARHK